jgi:hypothetical protein
MEERKLGKEGKEFGEGKEKRNFSSTLIPFMGKGDEGKEKERSGKGEKWREQKGKGVCPGLST